MFCLNRLFASRHISIVTAAAVILASALVAGTSGLAQTSPPRTGSSSSTPDSPATDTTSAPRIAQPEAGGSAITLENSEPLFFVAVALNACGYDAGLANSSPIRQKIRSEINEELTTSEPARAARDALCIFMREHALNDASLSLAQYVSLALFLGPPPSLTPTIDESELPPDATQVVAVLPLLRTFAETAHLEALWFEHRQEYESFIDRIHGPLTKMVLDTNVYLHMPPSAYEGRRFLVLLEPMLAPSETNARIYAYDYVIVVSPAAQPAATVPMDLVRHTYLHFLVEPLVYSRASAVERLYPLLKPVQDAPLEYIYKSDALALLNECLIKAIEAQTMDVGILKPGKPDSYKDRSEVDRYEAEMGVYDRQAEVVRRKKVDLDMRQGWVLVEYFYNQLGPMAKDAMSLKDNIGPMVYGMDVDRERHRAEQVDFLPEGSGGDIAYRSPVRSAPKPLAGLDLAEMKLTKGDADGAGEIAEEALKTDPASAEAHYVLGRIALIQGDPEVAFDHLSQTIEYSHDPRTIAWAHIYLGRLYDIARDPNNPDVILPQRDKAIAEYQAALANRDSQPETKLEAEKGIKQPFALPKRVPDSSEGQDDSKGLDPSGKSEKESYRPTAPH